MPVGAERMSSYLDELPALFHTPELGRFLLAFEHVLSGLGDSTEPGLEEVLDGAQDVSLGRRLGGIERYFDPGVRAGGVLPELERVPDKGGFLQWLAGWVALVPRGDVGQEIVRQLVARSLSLYRRRGTKEGLEELLGIYALGVRIEEPTGWLQIGVDSRVGVDTRLNGPPPHYFRVVLTYAGPVNSPELARQRRLLEAIIDAEKPAHTHYTLDVELPERFQVEVHSTVGVDTMLG